jgi:hypothetical protein
LRKSNADKNKETLLSLYKIYDDHRESILWFLEELDANSYEDTYKSMQVL